MRHTIEPSPPRFGGEDWQEYARVARKTFGKCYQSYLEISGIPGADRNPHKVKNEV